jgi:formylmethanofuran dehydrogenase subunit E
MGAGYDYPDDFEECIRFHRHSCPGLAIGYAASKRGAEALNVGPAQDEEVVAIVENDSCAVDAVQVILGCTFGKGNLIFRDWGKQVFTFMDRSAGHAVRVSFTGEMPYREERHQLREKIRTGQADKEDLARSEALKEKATVEIISSPDRFFTVQEVPCDLPPKASIVETRPCEVCGEPVMIDRLVERGRHKVCRGCEQRG